MNTEFDSDLRTLLPDTLSDESVFWLIESLYAMAGALENIYFAQITRHAKSLNHSDDQLDLFDDAQCKSEPFDPSF